MDLVRHARGRSQRHRWTLILLAGCCLGCASPAVPRWADFGGDRTLDAALADDSFPTAAEAGVADTQAEPPPKKPQALAVGS
jgi:hypothetical protein